MDRVRLEPGWKAALGGEFSKAYMQDLRTFLLNAFNKKKLIYPKASELFAAFDWVLPLE